MTAPEQPPTTEGLASFARRTDAVLAPPATELVEAFFSPTGRFAAATFDLLGTNDPWRISTDDLLAVTLLDVRFRPPAVRALLWHEAATVADLLSRVPADLPLWAATDADLDAATAAWSFLCAQDGVGPVIAGKLMARKRPRLVPVSDSVIDKALKPPSGNLWTALRAALTDQGRRADVEALRPSGLTHDVSTLRLVDVAAWMRFSESTNARDVRQGVGLRVEPRTRRRRR